MRTRKALRILGGGGNKLRPPKAYRKLTAELKAAQAALPPPAPEKFTLLIYLIGYRFTIPSQRLLDFGAREISVAHPIRSAAQFRAIEKFIAGEMSLSDAAGTPILLREGDVEVQVMAVSFLRTREVDVVPDPPAVPDAGTPDQEPAPPAGDGPDDRVLDGTALFGTPEARALEAENPAHSVHVAGVSEEGGEA